MKQSKVLVVGSANLDMVFQCNEFPKSGETVLGGEFSTQPGGKGANQAVACGRLGGSVSFCGCVGNDSYGQELTASLQNAGVSVDPLAKSTDLPSGVACILVNSRGDNEIVVAPGSNGAVNSAMVGQAVAETGAEIVLTQLEIPMEAVEAASKLSNRFILNPAPARQIPDSILQNCWIITPNESELETLTGIPSASIEDVEKGARQLLDQGVQNVIVTLGARGCALVTKEETTHFPATPVTPIDTTAAGDAFNGALAFFLSQGQALKEAIPNSNVVAALSTTRPGAQNSMPSYAEFETAIRSH